MDLNEPDPTADFDPAGDPDDLASWAVDAFEAFDTSDESSPDAGSGLDGPSEDPFDTPDLFDADAFDASERFEPSDPSGPLEDQDPGEAGPPVDAAFDPADAAEHDGADARSDGDRGFDEGPIDLDLTGGAEEDRPAHDVTAGLAGELPEDLSLDTWPDPYAAVAGPEALDALLASEGIAWDDFGQVVDRLGWGDALDVGLDGLTTAVALGELGVDAHVEHGSLDDLGTRLDAGDEVVVSGDDGRRWTVRSVDDAEVRLVDAEGRERSIEAAIFEEAWEVSAYEMVLVEHGGGSAAGPIQLGGGTTVLSMQAPVVDR